MNIFASLVAIALILAAMCGGYRYSMHLYMCGALKGRTRHLSTPARVRLARDEDEASLIQVRDYGLRYARTGILVLAILLAALVLIMMALITSIF
jgi:hypothetical protein